MMSPDGDEGRRNGHKRAGYYVLAGIVNDQNFNVQVQQLTFEYGHGPSGVL